MLRAGTGGDDGGCEGEEEVSAPTVFAATFRGGSLDEKWSYLPHGAPEYVSPTGERYVLQETRWHSHEDDVMSHQVYTLSPVAGQKVSK